MPTTHTDPLPRYREVDYDDPSHKYFLDDVRYLSATQILEKFKNKFDPVQGAIDMAYRHGQTPEYWRKKWKKKTDRANQRGTSIHNFQEDFLYGRGYDSVDGKVYPVHNRALYPKNIDYQLLPDGVYPELKLWRHDWKIAGRSDKVIIRTVDNEHWHPTVDNHLGKGVMSKTKRVMDIEDYKTNQQIRTESFYTRNEDGSKEYKMMLGPLSHLMDCELNHYALQFSIYQYMGEYHGFLPGKRRMIFFRNDEEVYGGLLADLPGETKPVIRELPYLRDEVIAMLQHLRA